MTTIADTALTAVVTARIHALLEQRAWDRRWMRATWTPARHDRETELRALVRLMRTARRLARQTEQADPITAAKAAGQQPDGVSYHDWQSGTEAAGPLTEDELWGGYGIENREGDPAFNGAFSKW